MVQVGSIELRVKTGHFKLVNWISCQVDPYFLNEHFFLKLQKQINDNLFRENEKN